MEKIPNFVSKFSNKNVEIECRFSEQNMLGVQYDTFQHVISMLSLNKTLKKVSVPDTTVYALKHKQTGEELRLTRFTDRPSIVERKKRIAMESFKDYNFRIVASSEEIIPMTEEKLSEYTVTHFREKKRISFTHKNLTIDLTEVIAEESDESFEIECELKEQTQIAFFSKTITKILKLIQKSDFLSTNNERQLLLSQYATLTKQRFPNFVGPLPYTISNEQFESGMLSCNFAVTVKTDGLRKLMFVNNSGKCLMISRAAKRVHTYYAGHLHNDKNSLYDGEFIIMKHGYEYHIFDCLFHKGKDLRDMDLIQRLNHIPNFTCSIQSPSASVKRTVQTSITIRVKSHFYNDIVHTGERESVSKNSIYEYAYNLWNDRNTLKYNLDGLIFTPVYAPYYNENILKWKPVNTIDFMISKNHTKSQESWTLKIAGFDNNGNYIHFDFGGFDRRGSFSYRKHGKTYIAKNTIPLKYGTVQLDAKIAKAYPDNSVVEFKFSSQKNQFIPINHRGDKSYANGIMAVNDAYHSIRNPITHPMLKKNRYIFCGRKFHNVIKNYFIQKYTSKSTVLDIGVGAGGNIQKYSKANVKKLIGINIVPVEYKYNKRKMQFFHVKNSNFYNVANVLKTSNTKLFDNVTCFFAVHYFFKNDQYLENFYQNVEKSLKPGGKFICAFMNNEAVLNLLKGNKKYESNIFSINHQTNHINVDLKGSKYFKTSSSKEYLVDTSKLMKTFKNYSVIENAMFSTFCDRFPVECKMMNNEEKKFSFLNQILVMKKKM